MDIAEALNMQKTNVSRAVKNLIEFEIILEGPKTTPSVAEQEGHLMEMEATQAP
nr:helix-turn-helix domain-containing protein [Escherichia coli]